MWFEINRWIRGVPKKAGRYWTWCAYDGNMMPITIENHKDYQIVCNESGSATGMVFRYGILAETELPLIIFTHYFPWTEIRPKPPRQS